MDTPTPREKADSPSPPEPDFSSWLQYNRRKRELTYQIGQGFQNIRGQFSYLRLQGVTRLLTVLLRLTKQDLGPLQVIQSDPELNIARFLLNNVLAPLTPPELSPITDQEIQRALDVLQGVCLMHAGSKKVLRQINGLEVLLGLLSSPQPSIQVSALDALLSACLDSRANQQAFVELDGVETVGGLLRDAGADAQSRAHAAEFLSLFAHYLDEVAQEEGTADYVSLPVSHGANLRCVAGVLGDAATRLLADVPFPTAKDGAARVIDYLDSEEGDVF